MKASVMNLPNGKDKPDNTLKKIVILIIPFVLLTIIPLYLHKNSVSDSHSEKNLIQSRPSSVLNSIRLRNKCNIFSGNWVPFPEGPYYTNATNCVIDDRQNCMKFGRPDTEFMKWRWKPNKCELPRFDASEFLELMRGKSMAFVGDSLARNQMQSLVCLLATAAYRIDVSDVDNTRFRRWFYPQYNFSLVALWSTHLVKSCDADLNGYSLNSLMNLYLDEVDEAWAAHIKHFNYVIISAGQWFFRPSMYYEKGKIVGCHKCYKDNITSLSNYYGYRKAFRTSFETLLSLKHFKGVTILRTFSPSHFENGEWDKGGECVRRRPFGKGEVKLEGYMLELYLTQVEDMRKAERIGKEKGLKFMLLDTTEVMLMRPDGHPNHYGHWSDEVVNVADCVHWCLPGAIDTVNEFLLQMLKTESEEKSIIGKI